MMETLFFLLKLLAVLSFWGFLVFLYWQERYRYNHWAGAERTALIQLASKLQHPPKRPLRHTSLRPRFRDYPFHLHFEINARFFLWGAIQRSCVFRLKQKSREQRQFTLLVLQRNVGLEPRLREKRLRTEDPLYDMNFTMISLQPEAAGQYLKNPSARAAIRELMQMGIQRLILSRKQIEVRRSSYTSEELQPDRLIKAMDLMADLADAMSTTTQKT